jgi:hypothetical protein
MEKGSQVGTFAFGIGLGLLIGIFAITGVFAFIGPRQATASMTAPQAARPTAAIAQVSATNTPAPTKPLATTPTVSSSGMTPMAMDLHGGDTMTMSNQTTYTPRLNSLEVHSTLIHQAIRSGWPFRLL